MPPEQSPDATRMPPQPPKYRETLFDRHGPDAAHYLRSWGYGILISAIVAMGVFLRTGFHWWTLPVAIVAGVVAGGFGWMFSAAAGFAWSRVMVEGKSTPYVEQYSYQQALVMKGEADRALESFEAVILEKPDAVSPRIKAAELYVSERNNFRRAAELFREAQRIPTITSGEDVYVTNRLVDLLIAPLADPGRALVELRRLIDRHPGSSAADRARATLKQLKARVQSESTD